MPTFATGNTQWDQNLSTLGNALFPDPSKAGEAFYYGAKAREAQVDTSKKLDQLNSMNAGTNYVLSGVRPQPTYSTGPGGAVIMDNPNAPGAGPLPPPLMTPNVGPAISGTAGSPPGPGFPPGTPQPVLPNPTNPAANQAIIGALADKAQHGPSPLPTGSDGTPNPNSYGDGPVPAGTINPPGGGVIRSPRANPDGSPALANIDFGALYNLQVRAGIPGDQAFGQLRAILANGVKNGQINQVDAERQAAFLGEASMRNQAIQAASAATVEGMRTASAERIAAQVPEFVASPTDPSLGTWMTRGSIAATPGGVPGFNQTATPTAVTPMTVLGPTNQPQVTTTRGAQTGAPVTGATPAAQSQEQQRAQLEQQYRRETDPAKREQLRQDLIVFNQQRAPLDEKQVLAQRQINYRTDQDLYATPQIGFTQKWGVTAPAAFKPDAEEMINRRAGQLERDVSRADTFNRPDASRQAAERDLISSGDLQSPAEINQLRVPTRKTVTTLGMRGDPRVDYRTAPGATKAGPTEHMMVGLTPKGIETAKSMGINIGPNLGTTVTTPAGTPATTAGPATTTAPAATPAGRYPAALTGRTETPAPPAVPNAPAAGYGTVTPAGRLPKQGAVPPPPTQPPSRLPRQNPANAAPVSQVFGPPAPAAAAPAPAPVSPAPVPVSPAAAAVGARAAPGVNLGPAPGGSQEGRTGTLPGGQRFIVRGGNMIAQ